MQTDEIVGDSKAAHEPLIRPAPIYDVTGASLCD